MCIFWNRNIKKEKKIRVCIKTLLINPIASDATELDSNIEHEWSMFNHVKHKISDNTSDSVEFFGATLAMFSSNVLVDSSTCFGFSVDLDVPDCTVAEGKEDWASAPLTNKPTFSFTIPGSGFTIVTLSVLSNLPSAGFVFNIWSFTESECWVAVATVFPPAGSLWESLMAELLWAGTELPDADFEESDGAGLLSR